MLTAWNAAGKSFAIIVLAFFRSFCYSLIELDWYLTSNFSGLRNCNSLDKQCFGSSNFVQTKLFRFLFWFAFCFVREQKKTACIVFTKKFFNYLMLTFVCRKPSVRSKCVSVSMRAYSFFIFSASLCTEVLWSANIFLSFSIIFLAKFEFIWKNRNWIVKSFDR